MNTRRRRFMARTRGAVRDETQALLAAMTTKPSPARIALIDRTIRSLVSSGVWAKLDIFYMLAAHDSQAATLNWKSPGTFTLSIVSAMAFAADQGFTGDASADYLDTGWTAGTDAVNYTQNSASFGAWSRTTGAAGIDIGLSTIGAARLLFRNASNQCSAGRVNDLTNSLMASSVTDGSGLFAAERPDASTKRAYRNGAQIGSDVSLASTGLPGTAFHIGGEGGAGTSNRQFSMFFTGAGLGALHSSFYDANLRYMQGVGAA